MGGGGDGAGGVGDGLSGGGGEVGGGGEGDSDGNGGGGVCGGGVAATTMSGVASWQTTTVLVDVQLVLGPSWLAQAARKGPELPGTVQLT